MLVTNELERLTPEPKEDYSQSVFMPDAGHETNGRLETRTELPDGMVEGLVQRVQRLGDEDAYWQLASVYYPNLISHSRKALRRCGGESLLGYTAEDVASMALLKVAERLGKLKRDKAAAASDTSDLPPASGGYPEVRIALFNTTISNLVLDLTRAGRFKHTQVSDMSELAGTDGMSYAPLLKLGSADSAEDVYFASTRAVEARQEAQQALSTLLAGLSKMQQEFLRAYEETGRDSKPSLRETAAKLGISHSAARATLCRIRRKLTRQLTDGG